MSSKFGFIVDSDGNRADARDLVGAYETQMKGYALRLLEELSIEEK